MTICTVPAIRIRQRAVIVIVILLYGAGLLWSGRDLVAALAAVLGIGAAGAVIARWVVDETPARGPAGPGTGDAR